MMDAMRRLSMVDSSFLRIESESAHMHVGWVSTLELPAGVERLDPDELIARIAARLHLLPRFRQRIAPAPLGLGEPVWNDDPAFAVRHHVRELPQTVTARGLRGATNAFFSEQLRRDRPLWEIGVIPRLADGRAAILGKIHHAMVDGVAAVELGMLLFDAAPDAEPAGTPPWAPVPAHTGPRAVLDTIADAAGRQLRATAQVVGSARSPRSAARSAETAGRAALSLAHDALNPAPESYLNVEIGPGRTVVAHTIALQRLMTLKENAGVKLNDVVLAVCAGALRRFALRREEPTVDLRVMVPVNIRRPGEGTAGAGNRITFGFIEMPVSSDNAAERMRRVVQEMDALKRDGRIAGSTTLLAAAAALPEPLKDRAARIAASPRLYNLVVSNVAGPRVPLYACGARVRSIHPVIPIPDRHALSIGVLTYDGAAQFSCYADPEALPRVEELAIALEDSLIELELALKPIANPQRSSVQPRRRRSGARRGAGAGGGSARARPALRQVT
jgi:WS/DGAT/MGAT family acyltransferase